MCVASEFHSKGPGKNAPSEAFLLFHLVILDEYHKFNYGRINGKGKVVE